jgi:integrase
MALDFETSLDLKHEMVCIYRAVDYRDGSNYTKSHDVRASPIPPVLLPMLQAMHREQPRGFLFSRLGKRASKLREAVLNAGIERNELHKTFGNRRALRMHDLRATGISYLSMVGISDEGIRERAGHEDFETTMLYIGRGKLVSAALGDPFASSPSDSVPWPV